MDFSTVNFGSLSLLQEVPSLRHDSKELSKRASKSDPAAMKSSLFGDNIVASSDHITSRNGAKQFRTASGKLISIKKRTSAQPVVESEIDVSEIDNFIDMDHLFKRVELRNSLKKATSEFSEQKRADSRPLLTEKYKPSSVVELCSLGNDRQYRQVLQWLKKWSPIVFGEAIPDTTNDNNPYSSDVHDRYGRPHKKIILIHGPPGIGKTVAAHAFAKQMKYDVQEINAANSMDVDHLLAEGDKKGSKGAYTSLRLKLVNALTSNSVLSGKPTCIIIDEIDTCPNSNEVVRLLNDLVRRDGHSGKSKKPFLMKRPIICIANSNYLSRQGNNMDVLRSISELVAFKKPAISAAVVNKTKGSALKHLREHLVRIAKREEIPLSHTEVAEIIEACEGDVRACLNYLQFNTKNVNVPIMETKEAALNKDVELSWFSLVNMLFKRDSKVSKEENFQAVFDMLFTTGGVAHSGGAIFDKVLTGCFSRYLDVIHFQQDTLVGPAELSDWISLHDRKGAFRQDIDYMPALICLKIWSLFSCADPNINPTAELVPNSRSIDFESYEDLKANELILQNVVEKLSPALTNALGVSRGAKELLAGTLFPYLDRMLLADQLTTGSKSTLSLTPLETQCLEKITAIVKSLELRLESHLSGEANQPLLKLNPDWDSIVHFLNSQSKVAAKQMKRKTLFPLIAIQLESVQRAKNVAKRPLMAPKQSDQKRMKVDKIDEFFDSLRPREKAPEKSATHDLTRIWVKYNEGFSNAVRKNIGWADFWRPGAA